jgi:hypothetical protein
MINKLKRKFFQNTYLNFILTYRFPLELKAKVESKIPNLTNDQYLQLAHGLNIGLL